MNNNNTTWKSKDNVLRKTLDKVFLSNVLGNTGNKRNILLFRMTISIPVLYKWIENGLEL